MAELTVRPTRKRVLAGYFLCFVFLCGWLWAYYKLLNDQPQWLAGLGLLPFLAPILADMRARLTRMELDGGKLRWSSGLAARSSRVLDVASVQDVHVEQGMLDRMMGIGSISVETMGGGTRIEMPNIDRPNAVAEALLDAAQRFKQGSGK